MRIVLWVLVVLTMICWFRLGWWIGRTFVSPWLFP